MRLVVFYAGVRALFCDAGKAGDYAGECQAVTADASAKF
jgi:hypothetical protein